MEEDDHSLAKAIQQIAQAERQKVHDFLNGKTPGMTLAMTPEVKDYMLSWLVDEVLKLREEVGKLKNDKH